MPPEDCSGPPSNLDPHRVHRDHPRGARSGPAAASPAESLARHSPTTTSTSNPPSSRVERDVLVPAGVRVAVGVHLVPAVLSSTPRAPVDRRGSRRPCSRWLIPGQQPVVVTVLVGRVLRRRGAVVCSLDRVPLLSLPPLHARSRPRSPSAVATSSTRRSGGGGHGSWGQLGRTGTSGRTPRSPPLRKAASSLAIAGWSTDGRPRQSAGRGASGASLETPTARF